MKKSVSVLLCSLGALLITADVSFAGPRPVASEKEVVATPIRESKPRSGTSLIVRNTPLIDAAGESAGYKQELVIAPAPKKRVVPSRKTRDLNAKLVSHVAEVDGEGFDPGPQFLECNSTAAVTVLANEITYGSGGPQVPTRLDYSIDAGTPVPMFGGVDVAPLMTEEVSLASGQVLSFLGKSAYPNFDEPYPWINYNVPSDDAVNAAILINGSNFFTVASQKGVQMIPFGMQQTLQQILGEKIDWNSGLVTMPENEVVVLFELGATSPQSPAFDFNDLVVSITTNCQNSGEVVLRDSIGPDNALTNFRRTIGVTGGLASYNFVAVPLSSSENVSLRDISMVIASWSDEDPPLNFGHFDYDVRVWSSMQGPVQSPYVPDILNCRFSYPSNVSGNSEAPPVFGTSISNFDIETPSFVVSFDLLGGQGVNVQGGGACPPIALVAGQEYAIAVQPIRGNGLNSFIGIVDSGEVGPVEKRYSTNFPNGKLLTDFSTPELPVNGRGSYRITGLQQ